MRVKHAIPLGGLLAAALATASATAQCTAPANWFPHAETPRPAFSAIGADPCDFHRWSWQMFLRLTQRVDGDLRLIRDLYSSDDLFEERTHGKTLPPFRQVHRKKGMLKLRPRDAKPPRARGGREVNQAGDHGILVDQRHRAVYFATHVDEVYYEFVRRRHYNEPAVLARAPATETFPIGSLEVKSSWRIVEEGEEGALYTTTAAVAKLKNRGGEVVVDPNDVATRRVALVGLHVAGVVEGHPEFVWATFEARGNAPPLPAGMTMSSPGAVSAAGARFYAAGTAARDSNRSNGGHLTLNASAQTLDPVTQVVREIVPSDRDASRVAELNRSVRQQLGLDPAAAYELIGTLWVDRGPLMPNTVPGAPDRWGGSTRLANTTMETFRQSVGNCFSCHDTRAYQDQGISFRPMNLNVSHALRRSYISNRLYELAHPPAPGAAPKE